MYSFESRIRYSETDCEGKLSLGGLLNYFQDCSNFQSEELGVGLSYMREKNLAWVLVSWQIVIERYPEMGERVSTGTLPYQFQHFLGYRNFFMKDEGGVYLAKANSLWSLIDLESGKPSKPLPEMLEAYKIEERIPMEYADRKIALPGGGQRMEPVTVSRHLIDTNHHVNNEQYVRIAQEFLPEGRAVRRLRVEYKKQAFLGDTFFPCLMREGDRFIVSLQDQNGKVYANVELDTFEGSWS